MSDFLLNNVSLIIFLIATGIGLAAALVCWLLTRSVSEVPLEDRQYKDPPPLGFRMSWWLLQWIGHKVEGNDVGEFIPVKKLLGLPYIAIAPQFSSPTRSKE